MFLKEAKRQILKTVKMQISKIYAESVLRISKNSYFLTLGTVKQESIRKNFNRILIICWS
jgi:hypothetical protein